MNRFQLGGSALSKGARGLSASYGMAVVLLLLCVYYSWATLQVQQPTGDAAAQAVALQIQTAAPKGAPVMIVARDSDEDRLFAQGIKQRLEGAGYTIAAQVLGDPRDARRALEKASGQNLKVAAIATTPAAAEWTVLQDVEQKYPGLGGAKLFFAESYRWPLFLQRENLLNIANQIAVVAVIAVGMTLVIVTGGIDLSVGSLVALAAVVTTMLIRDSGGVDASGGTMIGASLAGIAMCAGIGLLSGAAITAFKLPPFIATLGVMQIASGLAFILSKGASIYEVPDAFTTLGRGKALLGLPNAVLLMAAIYILAHILMSRTKLGRYIYAVGGNMEAARLSGVKVAPILLFVYTVSGAMAGLGGVVLASQLKSGAPTYGVAYELYVIAAVVVGGTSLSGGQGKIFGTLIGAFIIAVIQNGMNLTGVESYTQRVVLGVVILGAVLLDMLKHRDWRWMRGRQGKVVAKAPGAPPAIPPARPSASA